MQQALRNKIIGFSLPELMVVISIIATLIAILLPIIGKARESSNRVACASNLRQIGLLMSEYSQVNRGNYPRTKYTVGATPQYFTGATDTDPFVTGNVLANDMTAAFFMLPRALRAPTKVFICPSSVMEADKLSGSTATKRSNFTASSNLSYSIECPYPDAPAAQAGYKWNAIHPVDFALAADINCGSTSTSDDVTFPTKTSPTKDQRIGNSRNHKKAGQNVLYADGRVEFRSTVFAGINGDNVYTRQGTTIATNDATTPLGFPKNRFDSVLGVIDPGAVVASTTTTGTGTTTTGTGNTGNTSGNGNSGNGNGNGNSGNGNSGNGNSNSGNGNSGNGNGNSGNGNSGNGNGNSGNGNSGNGNSGNGNSGNNNGG